MNSAGQDPKAIREQLQRVLVSPVFLHSERLRRFLTHCVEAALSGRVDELKEYTIGIAAFDRPTHYNPSEDPIVRVEARRLRKKLDEYYQNSGVSDPVVIQLPKGGYLPVFEFRIPKRARWRRFLWLEVCALIVCCAAAGFWWFGRRPPGLPQLVLTRLTSDHGLATAPALSPDASLVVYATDRAGTDGLDIWIQRAGNPARRLTFDPADDSQPALSPDASTVAFRSERQPPGVYLAPASGGTARLLVPDGRNPQYSPDGRWIAYWTGSPGGGSLVPAGKTYLVPSGGGAPRPLVSDFASAVCPVWSPTGDGLLVEATKMPGDGLDFWYVSATGEHAAPTGIANTLDGARMKFVLGECSLSWGKDLVLFSALDGDTQNLWRLPVSADAKPAGGLVRSTLGSADEALPFATLSGITAFASRTETLDVWRFPIDRPEGLARVTEGVSRATFPHARADRLAFLSKSGGRLDVSLQDLRGGPPTRITRAPAQPNYPQLCPDGETVLYSDGPNTFSTGLRSPSSRLICNGCSRVWQCNEHALFYVPAGSNNRVEIDEFSLASGAKTPLLVSPRYDLASAQKSADGWLAFHAITGAARRQIFVTPYRPGRSTPEEEWIPITDGAHLDRMAVWNERSDTLYFLSERDGFRCIWAQRLHQATKKPSGAPFAVRHFHSARLGLTAIGDTGAIGLSYAAGYLYFSLAEQLGDIWLARPEPVSKP